MNELDNLRGAAPASVLTSPLAREELLAELHALPELEQQPSRRRSPVLLAGLGLAAVGLGGGIATATGLMPRAFTDTYRDAFQDHPLAGQKGIDPSSATRVGSIAGPDGDAFTVLTAQGEDRYVCITSVIEALPLDDHGPADFEAGASMCQTATENRPSGSFRSNGFTPARGHDAGFVDAVAGEATRAEIRTARGQVIPMIKAEGWFFGWVPNPGRPGQQVVMRGYDDAGNLIGSEVLDYWYDPAERLE